MFKLFIIIWICLNSIIVFSQTNDFEIWSSVSVEKKINKKLRLNFEEEVRINENASQIQKVYSSIGINYKLNKHFFVGGYYRLEEVNKLSYLSTRHKFYIDFTGKYKLDRFSFSLRNRFQNKYSDFYNSETGNIPSLYYRLKADVKYNIKKNPLTPFIAYEIFYSLNNYEWKEIKQLRLTMGTKWAINKSTDMSFFYRNDTEINVNNPLSSYIIGVGYTYSF